MSVVNSSSIATSASSETTDTEKQINETLARLYFLSKLTPGMKIDVSSLAMYENTLLNRLYRTFLVDESRNTAFTFVDETFDTAEKLARLCVDKMTEDSEYRGYYIRLVSSMKLARGGCANLLNTYACDLMFISKLQTRLDTVDMKLKPLVDSLQAIDFFSGGEAKNGIR